MSDDALPYELCLVFDPSERRDKPYLVALFVNGTQHKVINYFATEEAGLKALDAEVARLRAIDEAMKQRRVIKVVKL